MARYTGTVHTDWNPDQAFRYLADFATVADWDPGVERSQRLSSNPLAAGARVRVESRFLGRTVPLVYETVAIDPPREVVLRAESDTVVSLDTMRFEPRPDSGTDVTYTAELTLRKAWRVLDPLLALAFRRVGDNAKQGLQDRLAGSPPATSTDTATTDGGAR